MTDALMKTRDELVPSDRQVTEGGLIEPIILHPSGTWARHGDRQFILGFPRVEVPAGANMSLSVQPQVIFRPERLIIPSNVAPDFDIIDVKVGKNSQFWTTEPVSAMTFSELAAPMRLRFDSVQISMNLVMTIRNLSDQTRSFIAAFAGTTID